MNKTAYPNLGEQVYEGRTASGLLVRVVPKPGFAKIYGFLAVDYGSMDTTFWKDDVKVVTPQGVAHYLEHKMFDMPSGSAMQDYRARGGKFENPPGFRQYAVFYPGERGKRAGNHRPGDPHVRRQRRFPGL